MQTSLCHNVIRWYTFVKEISNLFLGYFSNIYDKVITLQYCSHGFIDRKIVKSYKKYILTKGLTHQ